jgi:tetratricopeptide (TPR) repeat protein
VSFQFVLLLTLGLSFTSGGQVSRNADAQLEELVLRAQEAQKRGDYRRAAASYREILKRRPDLADARVNLGLMCHLLGEYREAVRTFDAALRQQPTLFVANLFLGLDLIRIDQPRRALSYLQRAQILNPRDEQAALGLSQAYAALGEYQKANDWYFHTTEINPKNADAWYGLGLTYLNLERSAVEQLAEVHPNSVYSQMLLGQSFEQQGRTVEAIELYRKLLTSYPTQPGLHAALGFAYVERGDRDAAEVEFQKELKTSRGCLLARLGLAHVSAERGEMARALDQLEEAWRTDRNFVKSRAPNFLRGLAPEKIDGIEAKAKRLTTDDKEGAALRDFLGNVLEKWRQGPVENPAWEIDWSNGITMNVGDASKPASLDRASPLQLFSSGHYTECLESLKPKLARLLPNDLLLLSRCAYDAGDYRTTFSASGKLMNSNSQESEGFYWRAKAGQRLVFRALMKAGQLDPNSPRFHLLLGDAYRGMQNYKEAEAQYRKAIGLEPGKFAAHLGLAMTFFNDFKFDQALPELEKALHVKSKDPEAHYMMGEILVRRGQHEEALPHLAIALNGAPGSLPRVHALLSKIYAFQGRTVEAITELKQALRADSDGSYHYQLYQLYKKIGDPKAATTALEKSKSIRRNRAEPPQQRTTLDRDSFR